MTDKLRRGSSSGIVESDISDPSYIAFRQNFCLSHHSNSSNSIQFPQMNTSNSGNLRSAPGEPLKAHQRLGRPVLFILLVGTFVILNSTSFICFLWFGNESNRLWRLLAQKDFMPQATTLAALAIRSALVSQIGACTAMLAALALERSEVALKDSAAVAGMRFSSPMPHHLLRHTHRNLPLIGLLSIFLVIFAVFQPLSTILLSDISTGFVLGKGRNHSLLSGIEGLFSWSVEESWIDFRQCMFYALRG